MEQLQRFLSGKKTYLVAVLLAAATVAHVMGWITDTAYKASGEFLTAGGLAALRAALAKGA